MVCIFRNICLSIFLSRSFFLVFFIFMLFFFVVVFCCCFFLAKVCLNGTLDKAFFFSVKKI